MSDEKHRSKLQTLLKFDAATCAVMGIMLTLASDPAADLLRIPAALLHWAGLLLLPIAGFMLALTQIHRVPRWASGLVIWGNAAWVVASLALPLSGLIAPNGPGWFFLLAQALVVAMFTILEWFETQPPTAQI